MERKVLQELDTYWDHEPRIPGGETPPSTAGGTPAATEPPPLPDSPFPIHGLWEGEGIPGGETPAATGLPHPAEFPEPRCPGLGMVHGV